MSCEYKWQINIIIKDHNICMEKKEGFLQNNGLSHYL